MSTNEKNVLYGGPDAPSIDPVSKSLGEILLKKFASFENKNIFVCISIVILNSIHEIIC